MSNEELASEMFPAGCSCVSTNSGGDCDWCRVYYYGAESDEEAAVEPAPDRP